MYTKSMDSLGDVVQRKNIHEPPQVAALKKYVLTNHGTTISVKSSPKYYLITVPSASLAGRLRVETARITDECRLDKRLVIHVGQ